MQGPQRWSHLILCSQSGTSHISPSSHQDTKTTLSSASDQIYSWVVTGQVRVTCPLIGQVRVTCPLIGQEASHWSQDQGRDQLGVLTDGSDGSVQQLVQDEPPKFV